MGERFFVASERRIFGAVAGLATESPEIFAGVANFVRTQQTDDGGFAGRAGRSDLYYTGFGVQTLFMTGELDTEVANGVLDYLGRWLNARPIRLGATSAASSALRGLTGIELISVDVIAELAGSVTGRDFFAERKCSRGGFLADGILPLIRPDGGVASSERGSRSSLYQTFLSVAATRRSRFFSTRTKAETTTEGETTAKTETKMEAETKNGAEIEIKPESFFDTRTLLRFLREYQRPDGGFAELSVLKKSGTNPTAAAVGLAEWLADDGPVENLLDATAAKAFLDSMRATPGGFRAHGQIVLPDLLSTTAATVACDILADARPAFSTADLKHRAKTRRFVASLRREHGGFVGATPDEQADVEYTFYGLLASALLREAMP